MIEGFRQSRVEVGDVALGVHEGGSGPALLLLHGFPQNHRCWARLAPRFAASHRVLVPDLRGYGGSDAPPDDEGHTAYSKRAMAGDLVGLLDAVGIGRAHVLGHDRGARAAYRMALDHPGRVERLGIVEVVPTLDFWEAWGPDLALAAYHWTFLAQPSPLPERLIGADPEGFAEHTLRSWTGARSLDAFAPEALASYRAQMADPARRHAMCADYRAGATTDRRHDAQDRAAGRRIAAPLRFLWAEGGFPARTGDPAGLWRRWADDVTDRSCACGHFAPEEDPDAVWAAFADHFA
jgi:haloacetate dehalogenase